MNGAIAAPPLARWSPRTLRLTLGGLLAFGALNAFAGGLYGMSGAPDVPRDWLVGSPFPSYVVPGAILFLVVGGALLVAAVAVFTQTRWARSAALAAAAIVLGFVAAQVYIIGPVSWLQPATAITALVVVLLAWRAPRAVDARSAALIGAERSRRDRRGTPGTSR